MQQHGMSIGYYKAYNVVKGCFVVRPPICVWTLLQNLKLCNGFFCLGAGQMKKQM